MKPQTFFAALLLTLHFPVLAQPAIQAVETRQSQIERNTDQALAQQWELRDDEFARYRELMQGPLGIYSPNIDPLSALGIEAQSDAERRRYAELQVQAEARRVEKLLAYQRAYDEAWQRLYPGMQRVNLPDAVSSIPSGNGRMAVFVRDDCMACEQTVQRLQASGAAFDLYMAGSRSDDSRIRDWAKRAQIDPLRVRDGSITLNHDGGRWLSLGVSGELPAVVREVNGQWMRQP